MKKIKGIIYVIFSIVLIVILGALFSGMVLSAFNAEADLNGFSSLLN